AARAVEDKLKPNITDNNAGSHATKAAPTRHADASTDNRPTPNEAFFVKRDLPIDHPDVVAGKRFRGANPWPQNLPGFRETVVAYCDELERLSLAILPIYAVALDLPADYFAEAFREPQYTLRISHHPHPPALHHNH